jgi:hypothetical protein
MTQHTGKPRISNENRLRNILTWSSDLCDLKKAVVDLGLLVLDRVDSLQAANGWFSS